MLPGGPRRPPPAPQPAPQHPGLRRPGDAPRQLLRLFYCAVLVCSREIAALTDFSGKARSSPGASGRAGYLTKLLQNHTAYACDGDRLALQCPRHSTISVQSAFYGQDSQMCGVHKPASGREGSLRCVAPTTMQKVLDECQNQRACHLLVNSRVFGPDLCPESTKYLLVSFKCQPNCLSHSALHVLSQKCYGKQRCRVAVNNLHFGSPCLPGVRKYLTVNYSCVPKSILAAIDPALANPKPPVKQNDGDYGIKFDPSGSRVLRRDGIIVSNSLAAFAYIRAHPERAALLFVSSVCVGLALTLCVLVTKVSCAKDLRKLQLAREHLVLGSDQAEEDNEEGEDEEHSSDSDFQGELSGLCRTPYPVYSSAEAAELAERIERREQILQEIWMNSGLDASLPKNMGHFY
ncbi:protein eva-1 homolog C isoform X5 [Erinaceus europaeus]|uniref:Protein eva-1 homolog C isoform X5 n=1 Tax=Erinaceus europaeus TaxID=9365 RepID=A0ABM3Y0K7_ERIEU|nr:protein eva-1 homolog C isoform X5 [Erinaceus europaeus]